MAIASVVCLLAAVTRLVSAHYDLIYPTWRGDSFQEPASQYTFPCAGINTTNNRTTWPVTGGSLVLDLHHPWTYFWINLGFGDVVASFNISLTPNLPYNETGNGTLCLPEVPIPAEAGVKEGYVQQ